MRTEEHILKRGQKKNTFSVGCGNTRKERPNIRLKGACWRDMTIAGLRKDSRVSVMNRAEWGMTVIWLYRGSQMMGHARGKEEVK